MIESSGVADPAGVIKSVLEPGIWGTVQLDGVITVQKATENCQASIAAASNAG